jgi:rhodanese-related sulfurtransferase
LRPALPLPPSPRPSQSDRASQCRKKSSRVTLEESKAAYDSRAALFLDVRVADLYAASHIPGALSIPLDELEARFDELDPNQWIITYCT